MVHRGCWQGPSYKGWSGGDVGVDAEGVGEAPCVLVEVVSRFGLPKVLAWTA